MLPLAAMMGGCADDSSPDAYNGTGALDVSLAIVAPEGLDVDGSAMPATGDFALTLTSAANGASHRWASFDDYEQGSGFTAGEYTVSAIYAPLNREGMPTPCARPLPPKRKPPFQKGRRPLSFSGLR